MDEKFKVFLGIKIWPHDSSSYEFWSNGALRSIRANKRIHREILSGPTVLVRDESGRFIESIMVKWDASSHDKTIEKITRGLYFHEFKKILNSNTKIDTYFFNALDNEMKNHIMFLRSKNIGGDDRFVYAFLRDDGNPEISFWFYQFYQGHWAGAFTGPEGFEWDGSKSVLDAISDALRLPKQPSDENSA
ncbi:MAG: hypothetical protein FJX46_12365 [Alphaproteobacteria bacterium]|nr:hypothetical protein [Alphaproteobacteria bacterium]